MTRRAFDGTTLGTATTVTTGVDWSTVRGAFVISGRLYTGHADGTMTVRDFDGASAGPATPVALNGLTSTQFPISRVTGMLFWNGRPYYTLTGDGRNWSTVSGMTMASGRLIYATTGTLSSITFTGGILTGTATVHNTGTWQSRGLFVLNLPT